MTINDNTGKGSEILLLAGGLGAVGVILGAFGAHALKARLDAAGMVEVWRTAVDYQIWHALALLALGFAAQSELFSRDDGNVRLIRRASLCWGGGVVLFSGSLYMLALGGPHWLGPVTPFGGLLLMLGWAFVLALGWRVRKM